MSDALQNASVKLEALKAAFHQPNSSNQQVTQLLSSLKLALVQFSFLTPSASSDPRALKIARETLELGAFFSVRSKDIINFERYISQLKTYYNDLRSMLPPSEHEYTLLGLNLLLLLAQNRIAEFHTELELIPTNQLHDNKFIQHPVEVEQWLMEGSYNKVIKRRDNVPTEEYRFFMDILVDTMRSEIATCSQSAYEVLPIDAAANLMFFNDPAAFDQFCVERGWSVNKEQGLITFQTNSLAKTRQDIPASRVIEQTLKYAQELDRIV